MFQISVRGGSAGMVNCNKLNCELYNRLVIIHVVCVTIILLGFVRLISNTIVLTHIIFVACIILFFL